MKKVIMLMMIIGLGLTSCKKEEIQPKVEPVVDCNCREVFDFGQTLTPESDNGLVSSKEVEVINICTGEISVELTDKWIVKRGDTICN